MQLIFGGHLLGPAGEATDVLVQAACGDVPAQPYEERIKEAEAQIPLKALGNVVLGAEAIPDEDPDAPGTGGGSDVSGSGSGETVPGTDVQETTGVLFPGVHACLRIHIFVLGVTLQSLRDTKGHHLRGRSACSIVCAEYMDGDVF